MVLTLAALSMDFLRGRTPPLLHVALAATVSAADSPRPVAPRILAEATIFTDPHHDP